MQDTPTEVRRLLDGYRFPAPKKSVVERVQQLGAGAEVLDALQRIPEGVYASAGEVAEHASGKHARR